jgi:hypothetical protein
MGNDDWQANAVLTCRLKCKKGAMIADLVQSARSVTRLVGVNLFFGVFPVSKLGSYRHTGMEAGIQSQGCGPPAVVAIHGTGFRLPCRNDAYHSDGTQDLW